MRKLFLLLGGIVFFITQAFAQRSVAGKVTDDKGTPLQNVSVTAKGTTTGTVTKADGTYSLNVPATAKALIFSSVDMATLEMNIGTQTMINVSMKPEDKTLQEVVLVGYSSVRKGNLTGAVSKIKAPEIENRPVMSFDQALTGKAAGVQVNTSSGLVGDVVNIRIRGASSLGNSSQPLIVIDGIPIVQGNQGQLYNPANPLSDLNPNDIESVEVLKDASATAIYGSRASAGVLLITTKKGRPGTNIVRYDGYIGYTRPSRIIDVLDAPNYTTTINKMRSNASLGDVIKYGDYNGDNIPDTFNTDWQKETYRNGISHNHNVSISGGTPKTTYYGSLNYLDFQNYIINNRLRRGSARLNLTTKATNWLTLGINTQYSRGFQYGIGSGTGGAASGIPLGPLRYYPNVPVKLPNGNFYLAQGGNLLTVGVIPNPVAVLLANYDNYDTRRLLASMYAEAQIIKGLKIKTQYSLDVRNSYDDQFWNPDVGDGAGLVGVAQNVDDENKNWAFTNTINYNRRFGKHDIGILAGTEYTKRVSHFIYASGIGIKDRSLLLLSTTNYNSVSASEGFGENGLASYFTGITYGFNSKYLFTGNFRADASSSFGINNRWGYFPSASAAWKISDEKFFKGLKSIIDELKFRGGYGVTGNNNIGNYTAFASFAAVGYAELPNTAAINLNNPGNPNLKWENSNQTNFGFDMTVWKNRIDITGDWYKKKSRNLVLGNPVLATLGFPGNTITQNIGKLETQGFELTILSDNISRKNFSWNTSFNIAFDKNKVIATNSTNADIFGGNGIARPGEELGAYYLIRYARVNPQTGWSMFYDVNGVKKMYNPSVAAANRWTDEKGTTVTTAITSSDRVVLKGKTPYPKYYGGMVNSLTFRQFDFRFDLQYAFDFYLYNTTLSGLLTYNSVTNKSTEIYKAWTTPGQQTKYQKLYWGDNTWEQASTLFLEKGDFVRIRNIQAGYTFSKAILEKVKLNNLRLFLEVENAYTITKYKGIDPEANANGNTNIGLGIDSNRPYLPRTITAGVNISF
jgi:TonB-linked SusC/RagA family outer membrane protein